MAAIGDAQFRIMCDMWGVDEAIKIARQMGMKPTKTQIEEHRKRETEQDKRFHDAIVNLIEDKK